MLLAVIGASGRVGREVVRQALGHGDLVFALAPDPDVVAAAHPRLRPMPGDVRDLGSLRAAFADAQAVISVFGAPAGRHDDDLYERGIANVLEAMAESAADRLVAVSALGALERADLSLVGRLSLLSSAKRACFDDVASMERRIMASGVDWTIVRPDRVTDGAFTGRYRLGTDGRKLRRGTQVSAADLAAFTLKALSTDLYVRRTVTIAY